MAERVAARLVTGPLAFLLGGVIELAVWVIGETRARLASRARGRRRRRRRC